MHFFNNIRNFTINFGPQHPSAHGVLRLILLLDGEKIIRAEPHIGLLHRATEKLIENKTIYQNIPYFDRLDYVSMMSIEHLYSLVIENLLDIVDLIPFRAKLIRMLFLEITRLLNHLLSIATHAMDVGAITPVLWCFELREQLIEIYERVCGARMHANYIRPGGVAFDIPFLFIDDLYIFIKKFIARIDELDLILSKNRIWKQRLTGIGKISYREALELGCSGVLSRSAGIAIDLRKTNPYEFYQYVDFKIPIGVNGDCYDRYLIRMEEMRESCKIIFFCIKNMKKGLICIDDNKIRPYFKYFMKRDMLFLINHFKLFSDGLYIHRNTSYYSVEAPKGETGLLVSTDGSNKLYRCKIRTPGFSHLQALRYLASGIQLADLVTIIGSLDIVFGEIDR